MPRVSVVIPTYNRAHLLRETVGSVLAQTYRDFEVIVIDDGSTDNSPEVAQGFPPCVRYFRQDNQGLSAVRNRGIELAQGEYIAFLDSDDALLEGALEKGVEVLDRYPRVGFSHGQACAMDEQGRIFALKRGACGGSAVVREGRDEIKQLICGNYICTSTVMVRRSALDRMGLFDPAFRHGSEDYELWIRLAKKYAVAYIAEPLAKYRVHPQSITAGRRLEEMESTWKLILEKALADSEMTPNLSQLRAKAYSYLYFRLGGEAYLRGNKRSARSYMLKALRMCPPRFWRNLALPWAYQFAKIWLPVSLLSFARRCRRSLQVARFPQAPSSPPAFPPGDAHA